MGMRGGFTYTGLRLYDENKERINRGMFDETNQVNTVWSSLREIPDDMHIIGLSCDPHNTIVFHVSFLLAKKGEYEILEKLSFPEFDMYPTKTEFDQLYAPEGAETMEFKEFTL